MFFRKLKEAVKDLSDGIADALDSPTDNTDGYESGPQSHDETDRLPVKCTIRIRSNRYNRLTLKQQVEVSSRDEYEKLKGTLLTNFKTKFGSFTTMSGRSVDVWNDKTFNEVVKTLIFDDSNLVNALKKHGKW